MIKSSRLSPRLLYSMQQKAGEKPGNEASLVHLPMMSLINVQWILVLLMFSMLRPIL